MTEESTPLPPSGDAPKPAQLSEEFYFRVNDILERAKRIEDRYDTHHAGMVMLLLQSRFLQRIWRGLAAAGKMALTNYLVQSIFLTLYFNGYGMGFYGRLNQFELYFLAAEVCLVQIVFSIFWLQYYHYGPAEWLLRRLAYGKGFRNRKVKPAPVQPEIPLFS